MSWFMIIWEVSVEVNVKGVYNVGFFSDVCCEFGFKVLRELCECWDFSCKECVIFIDEIF